MELRQLRPFQAFLAEGAKQKGRFLPQAIQLAEACLAERNPGEPPVEGGLDGQSKARSVQESRETAAHSLDEEADRPKSRGLEGQKIEAPCSVNKIRAETLKKRKPVVGVGAKAEATKARLAAARTDCGQPGLGNNSSQKSLLLSSSREAPTQSYEKKQPLEEPAVLRIVFDSLELEAVAPTLEQLAGTLSALRDDPESWSIEQREALYSKVNEFCCVCKAKSDREITVLVQRRVGSYMAILLRLLQEVGEDRNPFFRLAVFNLAQMLALVKHKTLATVRLSDLVRRPGPRR